MSREQQAVDITDMQLVMRIGAYAREVGINLVADWVAREREILFAEFGRDPFRYELAHAVQNDYWTYQFNKSMLTSDQTHIDSEIR